MNNILIIVLASLFLFAQSQLTVKSPSVSVKVMPSGSDGFRVQISPNGLFIDPPVQALLTNEFDESQTKMGKDYIINGNLRVDTDQNGLVKITRVSDNTVLLQTHSYDFQMVDYDNSQNQLYSASLTFEPNQGENIYGLGEHRTGSVQNKPIYLDFQRSQIYTISSGSDISIPMYSSSLGYTFLWNLPSFGFVSINNTGTYWGSQSTYNIDYWVATTNASIDIKTDSPYPDLIGKYADATGHPPNFPYFASGFWQSKNRYRSQGEIMSVVQGYISRSLPLSVIVIDWYNWVNFGDWAFKPACWPDPLSLTDYLSEVGVQVMVSAWPLVDPASHNFQPMNNSGFLVKGSNGQSQPFHDPEYFYDPFNPNARQFVFDQIKKGYYNNGIKVFWLDADEPERYTPDQSGQFYYALGRDLQVGMAFPRMHQQMIHDGLTSLGETEIIMLSRSAWAGTSRYAAAVWSGDIESSFEELAIQVKVAQNVAMSGIYWWTTDIGGYRGGDITNPIFQELIVRWFQFGAFCPLFRLHGCRSPNEQPDPVCSFSCGKNEVWEFGDAAFEAISTIIHLREQLRPYIMKHMALASSNGIPILRPMIFDFPNLVGSEYEDQYMFGPDWLVAPVTQYHTVSRSVYLPLLKDEVWTHYFTGTVYQGGDRYTIDTPLDSFPLFYRSKPAPITYTLGTQLYDDQRKDTVLCISDQCYGANTFYTKLWDECWTVETDQGLFVVPLQLYYSPKYLDNIVTTGSAPDSTYTVNFINGYVYQNPGNGLVPLVLYRKPKEIGGFTHITVASQQGKNYAAKNNYTIVGTQGFVYLNKPQ